MLEDNKQQSDEENQEVTDGMEIIEAPIKKKKKLPGWVIIPILAVIVGIGIAGSTLSKNAKTTSAILQTVEVQKDNIKQVFNTSGTVESNQKKIFYSPVNAPILTNNAKVGKAVKAGEVLVSFDVTNLDRDNQKSQLDALSTQYSNQDSVEQSNRAAQSAGEAQAAQAAGIQKMQGQVAQKQSQVAALDQSINEKIQTQQTNAQKAQQKQAEIDVKTAELTTKQQRRDQLAFDLEHGAYSDVERNAMVKEADDLKYQAIPTLEKEIANMKAEYAAWMPDTSVEETARAAAQAELNSVESALADAQSSVTKPADTSITSGQANNMKISENLAQLSKLSTEELLAKGRDGIKAEFDGIIAEAKGVEEGQATQGAPLFTLVSNKSVSVKLEVSANDFDNLEIGNKAAVRIGKKNYKGTVAAIDKIATAKEGGSPTIGAEVKIDNPDDEIYIGVNAKVTMTVAEKKQVLCLPNEVVNTSTEGDFVYIIKNGVVQKKSVELGVASNSKVEVASGLKKGEQVVSDTSGDLKDGMKATGAPAVEATSDKE